jgi:L-aspartate oxidase
MTTDLLIVGSGIAGLSIAIKMARQFPSLEVTLITKRNVLDSNTNLAQGGIAVVMNTIGDSVQQHIEDTLAAGDGCCVREVVERVVTAGPSCLLQLRDLGIDFDRNSSGDMELGREGGHSTNRIVHFKDVTGNHVASGLLRIAQELNNIKILENYQALDLVVAAREEQGRVTCYGAKVLDVTRGAILTIASRATVLATGGIGQVFRLTTNPLVATGDGIAMAHRVGASIADMEFIQFHPTSFNPGGDNPAFLISEALRGYGAYLRDAQGERFVLNHDRRGELASRDIVSKAIYQQMNLEHSRSISLDCRHLDWQQLKLHFPTIVDHCLRKGFNLAKQMIPVAPAAHYLCGGIVVDHKGETSVQNLFACGECSWTGLHGANRLASNSLLEALAYAEWIFQYLAATINSIPMANVETATFSPRAFTQDIVLKRNREVLQMTMESAAGIVRTNDGLKKALRVVESIESITFQKYVSTFPSVELVELLNLSQVSKLVLQDSLKRKENRGAFYNIDLL